MKNIILIVLTTSLISVSYAKTFTSKGLNDDFSQGLLLAQNESEDQLPEEEVPLIENQDQDLQETQEYQGYQHETEEPQPDLSVENDY